MLGLDRTLLRKNYFVFIVLMIVLTVVLLGWMTLVRLMAFHEYHQRTSETSARGITSQVMLLVQEKKRLVRLFVDEQIDGIRALAANPSDNELHRKLDQLLRMHFPDHFAFSIADTQGNPLFEDFDGLVSEMCLADLRQFSREKSYDTYVHPNAEGYHFDVMIPYGKREGIFFISFLADQIGPVLYSAQSHGHNLMLIYPDRDYLIEITADGARNHWQRNDYRLSADEKSRLVTKLHVPETRWDVVDMVDADFLNDSYRNGLIFESAAILSVFLALGFSAIVRLRREERQRELAELQKKELMGVISHELRSPASVVKTAVDLVRDGDAGDISDDAKRYLNMASTNTSRLLSLVGDFLDLQKMESGQLTLNKRKVALGDIVQLAVQNNALYAQDFGASCKFHDESGNAVVECDPHRIEQVLTNLLTNAAKYGAEHDCIDVTLRKIDHRVRVEVTDHGPGIPEHFRPRVFEKFAMANEDQKTKVKSSGLGLSIAKAIVERHNGSIGFETEVGKGTMFYFELPVAR